MILVELCRVRTLPLHRNELPLRFVGTPTGSMFETLGFACARKRLTRVGDQEFGLSIGDALFPPRLPLLN
jgi:hypothetical protein